MRALSGRDHDCALRVARWPLGEALHAYRALVREIELEAFRYDDALWTMRALLSTKAGERPEAPGWMKAAKVRNRARR